MTKACAYLCRGGLPSLSAIDTWWLLMNWVNSVKVGPTDIGYRDDHEAARRPSSVGLAD